MKSLYNIAGILPAQCRSNPNDCGIAWSEHRIQPPASHGKPAIPLQIIQIELDRKESREAVKKLDAYIQSSQIIKPIDPKTIKVGATVRLVGNFFSSQKWSVNFTKYQYYEVIMVDRENRCGMPVMIRNDKGINNWMFGEDLVLVESA